MDSLQQNWDGDRVVHAQQMDMQQQGLSEQKVSQIQKMIPLTSCIGCQVTIFENTFSCC